MQTIYDMIVIGGGPAGYTAALYAVRAGFRTLVVEKLCAGGQMALTAEIDNYPGFERGIDGFRLGERMRLTAERFGAETVLAEAQTVELAGRLKSICTDAGHFLAKTVVLATGTTVRTLGLVGEKALTGRGVHYCAACDGRLYRGKHVAVVGGGNSAVADALTLSRLCEKVTVIHRRDRLRATKVSRDALLNAENVEFRWNSRVTALCGQERLQSIRVQNDRSAQADEIHCDGIFVAVGREPASEPVQGQLSLDAQGYIIADETTRTGLGGVFAAGDVRTKALRQVVTAVADGATAAHFAEEYLISHSD